MTALRIALSGARGFVASHLAEELRTEGHEVVPLVRAPSPETSEWIPFTLGQPLAIARLRGFDAIVHCAYDFSVVAKSENRRVNVDGSILLFDEARRAGVQRLVFLSTLSAFAGCKSEYGLGKLAVEEFVTSCGGTSIRAGFVYDDAKRGMSGALQKIATTARLIPVPSGGVQKLYPVHADDLAAAVGVVLAAERAPAVISVAQLMGCTLPNLLRFYAADAGRSVTILPVPWQPMWLALRALETLGLRPAFRSDSLLSLVNQNPAPDFCALQALGIRVRTMPVRHMQVAENLTHPGSL